MSPVSKFFGRRPDLLRSWLRAALPVAAVIVLLQSGTGCDGIDSLEAEDLAPTAIAWIEAVGGPGARAGMRPSSSATTAP